MSLGASLSGKRPMLLIEEERMFEIVETKAVASTETGSLMVMLAGFWPALTQE